MAKVLDFLAMGGYAFYVWTSYALAMVLLLGIVFWTAYQYKRVRTRVFQRARQRRNRQ